MTVLKAASTNTRNLKKSASIGQVLYQERNRNALEGLWYGSSPMGSRKNWNGYHIAGNTNDDDDHDDDDDDDDDDVILYRY